MIDPRLLRESPDLIRAAQAKRGLSGDVVDRAVVADEARRQAIAAYEALRAEQKGLGKQVAAAQGVIRKAYKDLVAAASPKTPEQTAAAAAASGKVPQYLQNQIANYQAAVSRLTGS